MNDLKVPANNTTSLFVLPIMLVRGLFRGLGTRNATIVSVARRVRREWHVWCVLRDIAVSEREFAQGKGKIFYSTEQMLRK